MSLETVLSLKCLGSMSIVIYGSSAADEQKDMMSEIAELTAGVLGVAWGDMIVRVPLEFCLECYNVFRLFWCWGL